MFDLIKKHRFRLSPSSEQVFNWLSIGDNQYPLLVVDNFYANPDSIVKMAHKLAFQDPKGKHINSVATVRVSNNQVNRFIFKHYAQQLGVSRVTDLVDRNDHHFYRSVPSGSDLPIRREHPHSDGKHFIAGVLYLTPDKFCKGGTGFYRLRETGAEEKPPSPNWFNDQDVPDSVVRAVAKYKPYRAFQESSYENYEDFIKAIPGKAKNNRFHLSTSNEIWELRQTVPMKYNRLILYPAFTIHKAIYAEADFDGPPENRRLTEGLFYKYPQR